MKLPSCIAAVLLALPGTGHSAIYHSGIRDFNVPGDVDGLYIRLPDGIVTFAPVPVSSGTPWINLFFSGNGIATSTYLRPVITAPPSGNGDGLVFRKLHMEDIGAADHFASGENGSENHTGVGLGQFQTGTPGYMGFAMSSTIGGPVNYGWMRITIGSGGSGTVHDWAYETTPGVSIAAGAVPEPGSGALIGLAGAVLLLSRRRS